ncbi:hypothetical protein FACS189472_06540 [Alphaproteobacteria bacterium]|nr:hypothetical protein FACS189472_06540 [Alphaproteobacteria bacterium]
MSAPSAVTTKAEIERAFDEAYIYQDSINYDDCRWIKEKVTNAALTKIAAHVKVTEATVA